MLRRLKDAAVPAERFDDPAATSDRFPVGVLHHVEREEYTDAYEEVRERARRAV
jgi:hypothetical protein